MTIFSAMTLEYGLPPKLLDSLCFIESGYNLEAVNRNDGHGDSLGVCQVKLKTAKWMGFRGTEKELMNPVTNAKYSAVYLKYQLKRYGGNVPKALTAYNRGNAKGLKRSTYSDKVIKKYLTLGGEL